MHSHITCEIQSVVPLASLTLWITMVVPVIIMVAVAVVVVVIILAKAVVVANTMAVGLLVIDAWDDKVVALEFVVLV